MSESTICNLKNYNIPKISEQTQLFHLYLAQKTWVINMTVWYIKKNQIKITL